MINVHITEDHKLISEGLTPLINKSGIAVVTGISSTLNECRNAFLFSIPDILLLDISLPDGNGMDFCEEVKKKYPSIKVIALTIHNEYSIVQRMFGSGASGYVLKDANSEEVIAAIKLVMNDGIFISHAIEDMMNNPKKEEVSGWLSVQEKKVLIYIADGYSSKKISENMGLTIRTVETYRKNIKEKYEKKSFPEILIMALKNGVIDLTDLKYFKR
jgi:DNA-binding NarL/FixJ family response regulator